MTATTHNTPTHGLSDAELIKIQRATVDEHVAAENAGDWETVYSTFTGDERSYYDVTAMAKRFHGMEGVREYYTTGREPIPDFELIVRREYDTPGCLIREITLKATHTVDFNGIKATGKKICFDMVALFIFDDVDPSKLIAERTYFDGGVMERQMRGEEEAHVSPFDRDEADN